MAAPKSARQNSAHKNIASSRITPLWIVASFVTFTEVVLGYALTKVDGGVQVALTTFVICFALIVAGGFFAILWNRPYVFYSPSEYAGTDPKKFIEAMRTSIPARIAEQVKIVEKFEEKPDDKTVQFALIDSLIDEPLRQHLILMHEKMVQVPFESGWGHKYETGADDGRTWSGGHMSGREMAKKLDGTGLVTITVKGPSVELTQFGHEFSHWLVESGRKADFLKSTLGEWGTPKRPDGMPPEFYNGTVDDGAGKPTVPQSS